MYNFDFKTAGLHGQRNVLLLATESRKCLVVFFFQAEDGIRDYKVTGVQTCALPISKKDLKRLKEIMLDDDEWKLLKQLTKILQPFYDATKLLGGEKYATASFMYYVEIGRASCRERV